MSAAALVVAALVAFAVVCAGPGTGNRLSAARAPREPEENAEGAGSRRTARRQAVPPAPASRVTWWRPGRSGAPPPSAGRVAVAMDVVAAALSAGLPPVRALEVAAVALPGPTGDALSRVAVLWRLGADAPTAWQEAPSELEPLRRVLHLVGTAGVPGVALLHAAATELRRRERRRAQARAEALAVRMVLPLGLCALPAFVAWAVVPVVLSLAQQVLR